MGSFSWQLKTLWLSTSGAGPSRIWYEVINRSEINKAFNMEAMIERASQVRWGRPVRFNKRRQRFEINTKDLG